jgi:predicted  nucleic acid-binding Zn-ribbon protein
MRAIETREEVRINRLKQELAEADGQYKKLAAATRSMQKENQNQISSTVRDIERMKATSVKAEVSRDDDEAELKQLKQEVEKLKQELETEEKRLRTKREENEKLKREIGHVKHEITFFKRGRRRI